MIASGKFMWAFVLFLGFLIFLLPWTALLYYTASLLQIDVTLPENQNIYIGLILLIPALLYIVYLVLGIGQTFFDVWETGVCLEKGETCQACKYPGKSGQHYYKHYLCNACIQRRYRDMRALAGPVAIMIGIGIAIIGFGNAIFPQEAGPSVTSTSSISGTTITTTTVTISSPMDTFKPYFSILFGACMGLCGLFLIIYGLIWISRLFKPLDETTQKNLAATIIKNLKL